MIATDDIMIWEGVAHDALASDAALEPVYADAWCRDPRVEVIARAVVSLGREVALRKQVLAADEVLPAAVGPKQGGGAETHLCRHDLAAFALPADPQGQSLGEAPLVQAVGMLLERQSSMAAWLAREIEDLKHAASFQKPVMSMDEAAAMVGVSRKRLENLVFEERQRLGRLPDFVCDADGKMQRRVLRDELVEWMKKRRAARGRPPKR